MPGFQKPNLNYRERMELSRSQQFAATGTPKEGLDSQARRLNCLFDASEASKESGALAPPGQLRLKDKVSQALFVTFATSKVFSTPSTIG